MAGVADLANVTAKLAVHPSQTTRHNGKSQGAANMAHQQVSPPNRD